MPHFFSQIQSMYESPRQNWFSIFRPYYLLLKLFKRRKCASVIQPNSFKWTIHIYCWWCWGVYANSFSLCSGRVCPFSPLTTRRRRQLNVVVWSLLKELAEVSFLTKTSALSLPKFKRMLPVLPYWVLILMLSAALIASKLLRLLHPETNMYYIEFSTNLICLDWGWFYPMMLTLTHHHLYVGTVRFLGIIFSPRHHPVLFLKEKQTYKTNQDPSPYWFIA